MTRITKNTLDTLGGLIDFLQGFPADTKLTVRCGDGIVGYLTLEHQDQPNEVELYVDPETN